MKLYTGSRHNLQITVSCLILHSLIVFFPTYKVFPLNFKEKFILSKNFIKNWKKSLNNQESKEKLP
jgi:hypothetical protein